MLRVYIARSVLAAVEHRAQNSLSAVSIVYAALKCVICVHVCVFF